MLTSNMQNFSLFFLDSSLNFYFQFSYCGVCVYLCVSVFVYVYVCVCLSVCGGKNKESRELFKVQVKEFPSTVLHCITLRQGL